MKTTKKGEYALRVMMDLSLRYKHGLVQTDDLALREKLPRKYLEQVLLDLKKAGFLISKRGSGGGYVLARSPGDITIGEVLGVIDGPIRGLSCVTDWPHVTCPQKESCGLRSVMDDVGTAIGNVLNGVTFADVNKRTTALLGVDSNAVRMRRKD